MDTVNAHRRSFALSPSLIHPHGTMDVGNNGVGVRNGGAGGRNVAAKLRNNGMGVYDALMDLGDGGLGNQDLLTDVGNDHMRVHRKFGLGVDGQRRPLKSDGTYIEDMEDPVEV